MVEKLKLNWDEIEDACSKIAEKLKNLENFEIVGITRGGLIPAVIVAHKLNMRMKVLDVHTFKDGERGDIVCENVIKSDKKLVFIDDIYDTGTTCKYIESVYPNSEFHFIIDKRLEKYNNDIWYVFPWEN